MKKIVALSANEQKALFKEAAKIKENPGKYDRKGFLGVLCSGTSFCGQGTETNVPLQRRHFIVKSVSYDRTVFRRY